MDRNELIEIIKANPKISKDELLMKALRAGVEEDDFNESWRLAKGKMRIRYKLLISGLAIPSVFLIGNYLPIIKPVVNNDYVRFVFLILNPIGAFLVAGLKSSIEEITWVDIPSFGIIYFLIGLIVERIRSHKVLALFIVATIIVIIIVFILVLLAISGLAP